MKISIILPAKNEEKLIKKAIEDIESYLKSKDCAYEMITVINDCRDRTEIITRDLAKKDSNLKVVKSRPGYGFALKKGLETAQGDYVIIFNVDFYEIVFIDMCFADLLGKDLIIGSKMVSWSEDKRELGRRLVSKVFNLVIKIVFGFKGTDTHGIKVMRKVVVKKILPQCKTTGGILDTELILRTQYGGFKVADFPVSVKEIRPSRFPRGLRRAPTDIVELYRALRH